MDKETVEGPERATLLERFVNLIPLPYLAGAALIAALVGIAIYLALPIGAPELNALVVSIQVFYPFFAVRYMRQRIVESERELLPLLPLGETTWHRIFGKVSSPIPPVALAAILDLGALPPLYTAFESPTGFPLAVLIVANAMIIWGFGTTIWVYSTCLWGLHRLGKEPLDLRSVYEDRMMGLRPVGSLSLSFVFVYFGSVLLGYTATLLQRLNVAILGGVPLILAALVFFFLPLSSIHRQMVQAKQRGLASIRKQLEQLVKTSNPDGEPTGSELSVLKDLRAMMTLESAERRVSALPTWPIDTSILSRLLAIVLSFTAIMLARIVQLLLRF